MEKLIYLEDLKIYHNNDCPIHMCKMYVGMWAYGIYVLIIFSLFVHLHVCRSCVFQWLPSAAMATSERRDLLHTSGVSR